MRVARTGAVSNPPTRQRGSPVALAGRPRSYGLPARDPGCNVGLRPMVGQTLPRGRDRECAALDGLLDAVHGGQSRTLVLRGEAGVGKTALLDYAISSAPDLRVLRAVGVESEMELAFAS